MATKHIFKQYNDLVSLSYNVFFQYDLTPRAGISLKYVPRISSLTFFNSILQEEVQERAEKAKIKAAQGGKHTSTNISYNGSVLGDSTASTLKTRTQENVIQDRTDS